MKTGWVGNENGESSKSSTVFCAAPDDTTFSLQHRGNDTLLVRPIRYYARLRYSAPARCCAKTCGRRDSSPKQSAHRYEGQSRGARLRHSAAARQHLAGKRVAFALSCRSSRAIPESIPTPRSPTSIRTSLAKAISPAKVFTTLTRFNARSKIAFPKLTTQSRSLRMTVCTLRVNRPISSCSMTIPRHLRTYAKRQHRWTRGDWQIAGWLFPGCQ